MLLAEFTNAETVPRRKSGEENIQVEIERESAYCQPVHLVEMPDELSRVAAAGGTGDGSEPELRGDSRHGPGFDGRGDSRSPDHHPQCTYRSREYIHQRQGRRVRCGIPDSRHLYGFLREGR